MIAHIQYADLETNQSDEICETTFWCYFNSHGDITRMINDQTVGTKKKENAGNNSSKSKFEHNQQEDTKETHQLVVNT